MKRSGEGATHDLTSEQHHPDCRARNDGCFPSGISVHFSSLNNSNEIIQFRCLDPDINNNGAVLESSTRKKRPSEELCQGLKG